MGKKLEHSVYTYNNNISHASLLGLTLLHLHPDKSAPEPQAITVYLFTMHAYIIHERKDILYFAGFDRSRFFHGNITRPLTNNNIIFYVYMYM